MALKITSQIGTDKGITSEAYVRISDYQISKYGSANFRLEIYMSQADVISPNTNNVGMFAGTARNQQIGENLWVQLTKEVSNTVTVQGPVVVEYTEDVPGPVDEDGNLTTVTVTKTRVEMQDIEQEVVSIVPDMSQAEDTNIFAFGYGKLKAKLQELFGEENVIDC